MPTPNRTDLAAYVAAAVVVAVLGWWALRPGPASPPAGTPATVARAGAPADGRAGRVGVRDTGGDATLVHVVGAVHRPGVYRLRAGARVQDAVRRAGGATASADLQGVNLAAKVTDAQQVVVPGRVKATPSPAPVPGAQPAAGMSAASPVNLNTATLAELDTLDGIGPSTAQKILDFRTQQGGFHAIEQLADVPGIGPKRLEAIRTRVRL